MAKNSDSAGVNKLTGKQFASLCNALTSAIPEEETLEQIMLFSLEDQLSNIPKAKTHRALIVNVVKWVQSQGKIRQLIIAASLENPGNPFLQKFAEDHLQIILELTPLPLLGNDLLTSLLQILPQRRDFTGTVLLACSQTLPDIEINSPELREQLFNNEISYAVKWLILLDLFLITWERNNEEQLYIVLFIQNLKSLEKGAIQTALTQWLNDLPESLRPVSQASKLKMYPERPSDKALKNLQAYFLIIVEPVETSDSNRYMVNGYVITRLGNEKNYKTIDNISLRIILPQKTNKLSQDAPYYTFEQIENEFPEWLVQVTEWIGIRRDEIEDNYNLEFSLPRLPDVLAIEFWLPFEHLCTRTESWKIYGLPSQNKDLNRILGEVYSVLIRSFDRFDDQESLDRLAENCEKISALQNSVDVSPAITHNFHLDCLINKDELQRQLNKHCLIFSLTCPLCTDNYISQRKDLFTWMLDKGIPLALWSRSVDLTDDQTTALEQKMQGLLTADIFNQLEQLFKEVKKERTEKNKLAIWCDEPERLKELKKFRNLKERRLRA